MPTYTVGSVPYVNAIPLTRGLSDEVRVVFDVPSRLPAMLASGEADAILVSSVDALRTPGRRLAAGACIGTRGPVESVRLFSKVPFAQIGSLALDLSSMTSNRLAQILLAELYDTRPATKAQPPDLDAMLEKFDACVLIGDLGMTAPSEGLHVLDMGDAWLQLTGKPFVWAGWIGEARLTPGLAAHLAGWRVTDACVEEAAARPGWTPEMARHYFEQTMEYRLDDDMLEGLREFQRRLLANGFEDCRHFPEIVAPSR